jgi:hypothetical protein
MDASWSSVLEGCAEKRSLSSMVPRSPERSDLEAWRHNELLPLSEMASTRRRFSF